MNKVYKYSFNSKKKAVLNELLEWNDNLTQSILNGLVGGNIPMILGFFKMQGKRLSVKLHSIDIEIQESEENLFLGLWLVANTWENGELPESSIWALKKYNELITNVLKIHKSLCQNMKKSNINRQGNVKVNH